MLIFRSLQIPKKLFGSVLAIGNFDGVHLGHQSVILKAKKIAKDSQSKVGVLTFEPIPKMYFNQSSHESYDSQCFLVYSLGVITLQNMS